MIDIIITVISIALSYYYTAFMHVFANPAPYKYIVVFIVSFLICWAALFILFGIICVIISLPVNINKEYAGTSRFYTTLFGLMLEFAGFLSGARVIVNGRDKIPRKERFLFVSNHRSNYDPIIQCGEMKLQPMAFISKRANFRIPFIRRYMVRCRYIPLERKNMRNGAESVMKAARMISSGQSCIGVYPEGTRNTGGNLLDFHNGCFKTALWAKCPIVVSVIRGTENIRKNFPFRRTKVVMDIIDVIPYNRIEHMKTGEISELVRNMMEEHLKTGGKK